MKLEPKKSRIDEEKMLKIRDGLVAVAAALFVISLFLEGHVEHVLRGVAYLFGASAYVSEIVMLTDCFKKKLSAAEMFMPYVFGVLYVILSISYFLD